MNNNTISNAERYKRERQQQVKDRHQQILFTARELFLENGIEPTTMQEIADAAQISKMTLYRYFPDRASVAIEVAISTIHEIRSYIIEEYKTNTGSNTQPLDMFTAIIDSYPKFEEGYRFMAMFDNLYYSSYPTPELHTRYRTVVSQIFGNKLDSLINDKAGHEKYARIMTITNMIMAFLQRLALRGELMSKEQQLPVDTQLQLFRGYIVGISKDIILE